MSLTLEELQTAIQCAEQYPKGFGFTFGHGPLTEKCTAKEAATYLQRYPEHTTYG